MNTIEMIKNLARRNSVVASSDVIALIEEFDAVSEKQAAVVAENAALKAANGIALQILNDEETMVTSLWASSIQKVEAKTPATDAAVREIQARGVEKLADKLDAEIEQIMRGAFFYGEISSREEISKMVREFATELRGGEHSQEVERG